MGAGLEGADANWGSTLEAGWRRREPPPRGEGVLAVATGSTRGDGVGKGVALGKQWLPLAGLVGCRPCAPCSEKQPWSWLRLPGD